MINVSGGVYFAITPKCVMGGGSLHMGLDVGPVSAWLDVSLDVFVQFKPFHYTADLMVSVGCAISIDVWFVHIRISVSLGAALHIEGPDPFGGVSLLVLIRHSNANHKQFANIEYYLFSFTIHFGGNLQPPPAATLREFYAIVGTPGPTQSSVSAPEPNPNAVDLMMSQLKFTLDSGLFPQPLPPRPAGPSTGPFPDSGPSKGWTVKSGAFSFSITCDFALSGAEIVNEAGFLVTAISTPTGAAPTPFFSKPMQLSDAITSNLQITIYSLDEDDPSSQIIVGGFTGTMIVKDVPKAIWGQYVGLDDPGSNSTAPALRDPSNPTMSLCMGVTVYTPVNPDNLIESGIQQFDPTLAFRESLGSYFLDPPEFNEAGFLVGAALFENDEPEIQWKQFAKDWADAGNKGKQFLGAVAAGGTHTDGMLKMAAHWLGWDNPPPSADSPISDTMVGQKLPWMLDGTVPSGLIASLDTEFAVLPRECGGAAA